MFQNKQTKTITVQGNEITIRQVTVGELDQITSDKKMSTMGQAILMVSLILGTKLDEVKTWNPEAITELSEAILNMSGNSSTDEDKLVK